MFIPMVGLRREGAGSDIDGPDFNAWQSFSFLDIVLFLIALVAIGLAVARAAGNDAGPSAASRPDHRGGAARSLSCW